MTKPTKPKTRFSSKTARLSAVATIALLAASACASDDTQAEDEADVGETASELYDPASPPAAVATDACDDSTYAGESWSSTSSDHFTAWYLPGTAAEADAATILAVREAAYADIRTQLGIVETPTIDVYLSPNRLAAGAHGRGLGTAYPSLNRYEVVYPGSAQSFEVQRPGHMLARTLEYYIDTANAKRIPFLATGLAEYLDQSGRDLHDAYAVRLHSGAETRIRVSSLESTDTTGKNTGRAGSFVKFLIDRYGMATFLQMYKATAVTSVSGCTQKSAVYGCISSAAALTSMLDGVITAYTDDSWATVADLWKATVDSHLATASLSMPRSDRAAITNLVNVMDQAIVNGDAATYRSTMEGFYCEWGGEAIRDEIAQRTIDTYGSTSSVVARIYPTGIANFTTARVTVRRIDERNVTSYITLSVERFPEGWRVTYGPDWY